MKKELNLNLISNIIDKVNIERKINMSEQITKQIKAFMQKKKITAEQFIDKYYMGLNRFECHFNIETDISKPDAWGIKDTCYCVFEKRPKNKPQQLELLNFIK